MTQSGKEGNRDSKILCCHYRMRSTSTGVGNWDETRREWDSVGGGPNYEIREHFPDWKAD